MTTSRVIHDDDFIVTHLLNGNALIIHAPSNLKVEYWTQNTTDEEAKAQLIEKLYQSGWVRQQKEELAHRVIKEEDFEYGKSLGQGTIKHKPSGFYTVYENLNSQSLFVAKNLLISKLIKQGWHLPQQEQPQMEMPYSVWTMEQFEKGEDPTIGMRCQVRLPSDNNGILEFIGYKSNRPNVWCFRKKDDSIISVLRGNVFYVETAEQKEARLCCKWVEEQVAMLLNGGLGDKNIELARVILAKVYRANPVLAKED